MTACTTMSAYTAGGRRYGPLIAASLSLVSAGVTLAAAEEKRPEEALSTSFVGKTALITGASGGMALQIAKRLASAGANVILVDRNEAGLERAVAAIGTRARAIVCDLRKLDDAENIFKNAGCVAEVDLLVNCAGIATFEEFGVITPEVWDMTMDVNAKAIVFLSQIFAKGMKEKGGGAIVNISSQSSSVVVSTKHMCYSTSKAAVDHITRISALCLATDNIRVNAVNPTVVRTELAVNAHGEEGLKKMAKKIPLGRICECDNVADAVIFLLSDRASMITGVTLGIDGGFVPSRI